jgi:hypothetical protein
MPGLLAQLDLEIGNFDVGAMLDGVIGQLGNLGDSVGGLTEGPGVVGEILGALGNPPQPEGLDGISNFNVNVTGVLSLIPSDTSGPLAPLLAPFQGLSGSVGIGVSIQGLSAAFDAIKALVELTTGRVLGGASTMPDGEPPGETLDLAKIRGTLDEIEGQIDQFGEVVDPSQLLTLLARFAPGAQDLHTRWPKLPVTADMFEAFDLVARWQAMSPAELTEHLGRTLSGTARFVAFPRTRLIDPALSAAREAARAGEILTRAKTDLVGLLGGLPARLAAGEPPRADELATIQARLGELESLATVLRLAGSPLGEVEALPRQLEREFMRVLRVVHPAIDRAALEQKTRQLVERIPAATASPLDDVVKAIESLDLSVITNPLSAVRDGIQTAVDTAEGVFETVREAIESLLRPLSEAIGTLVSAIGLDRLQEALGQLPDMINAFMQNEVMTRLTSLKDDVQGAVQTVSDAVDAFDPGAVKDQIEAMVRQIASVVQNEHVRSVFAGAQAVVGEIVTALEGFPAGMRSAADQSVQLLDSIRDVASKIPSELIPDAAKPALQTAVDTIADLDITGTVGEPLAHVVEVALEEGALPVLEEFEGLLAELRVRLEAFRPSSLISDEIDAPFQELFATLREFKPSDLLDQIADALEDLREQIHVVEPEELLRPLLDLHAQLRSALEQLDPDVLLKPVEDAIQDAIRELMAASGFEQVFGTIREFLEQLDAWVDLLDHCHDALEQLSQKLEQPLDVEGQLETLSSNALARIAEVDMAALAEPLEQGRVAAASLDHRRIAAELAPALRSAAGAADALTSSDARALVAAIRALPAREQLDFASPELARLGDRLLGIATTLELAVDPWQSLGPRLQGMAGRLEGELRGYALLGTINGRSVLADLLAPPSDVAGLSEQVGTALHESLRLPVVTLAALIERIGPHVASLTRDLGRLLGALHGKIDSITGDQGLLGAVRALDEGLDLLRNFDLAPLREPLREHVYLPIVGVVDAIDPEPLRAILQAVKDALESLLDLANLFDRSTIEVLDTTYATAVDKLAEFSPRKLLIDTVDPVYEELLAEILPLFDLVTRLREAVEKAAEEVPPEIIASLGRVETAFDALLHALPLAPSGGPRVSVSASASAG